MAVVRDPAKSRTPHLWRRAAGKHSGGRRVEAPSPGPNGEMSNRRSAATPPRLVTADRGRERTLDEVDGGGDRPGAPRRANVAGSTGARADRNRRTTAQQS